ncbi:MAG: regulatory protein ArsR [uncultured bacterium]|nr:MAG: regulatory protein ArsR [uncultured bacterium]
MREIERQSGLTIGTIQREAAKLSGMDLLVRRVDGNRTYYRANISHPLYKPIREMVLKTSQMADVLKAAFADEGVDFVFLFGSVVSGSFKPESDIDLFVIGDTGFRAVCNLLQDAGKVVGREINPHVMRLEEFIQRRKDKDHFVTSIMESPVQMIIGSENELRKLG